METNFKYPILYTFRRCPYAMRARFAIRSSKIKVEIREIKLKEKPSEFLNLSPKGTVPVLITNSGEVLEESLDIINWVLNKNDPDKWLAKGELESHEIAKLLNDLENKKILKKVMPDNTMLFRFSAITFNSHRIHYDKDYAVKKENYPDLVVQGPLIATIVMNLIQSNNSAHHLKEFNFRNVSPAFVNQNLIICAKENEVLVVNDNNEILMEGKYKF